MLAVIVYSEKRETCQEELDRVIGHARMSTFEDHHNLP